MELVKTVDVGEGLVDDFAGLDFPLFGETLFYRVVALRRFLNEDGEVEYAPSQPSKARQVRLIDDQVPAAPRLAFANDPPIPGPPARLPNLHLRWNRTAWNPRYHVYKMNGSGRWTKIHTLTTNDATVELDLAVTDLGSNVLDKHNANGQLIYHRFKVVTENSSGILSQEESALTI